MWRPPQRIKWKPSPGRWPTRDEAERSLLFSPITVGRMQLASRTWVPAMVPWRASEGRTRLLIQVIDFLAVRRRPEPAKFFARYLAIQPWHRERLGAEDWPEARVRAALAALSDEELARVLETRELEALRYGYRERVTDMDLPHVRDLRA